MTGEIEVDVLRDELYRDYRHIGTNEMFVMIRYRVFVYLHRSTTTHKQLTLLGKQQTACASSYQLITPPSVTSHGPFERCITYKQEITSHWQRTGAAKSTKRNYCPSEVNCRTLLVSVYAIITAPCLRLLSYQISLFCLGPAQLHNH